ncbi:MAG: YfhO family protein [Deltaproteobacteria bacterium]|nr:YfhO family protein [Deltaproteobacteria bacterium]
MVRANDKGVGGGAARWAPWAALFAAAAWVYRDVIFFGAAFLGLDASLQQEAFAFFRRRLLEGAFPTWNPHVVCGAPVFADAHSQLLYPPNLVLLFFPDTVRAWSFLSMAHLLVAGGGAYLFGREIGYLRTAALVSGLAFMLCQFVLSVIDEPVALHSIVWLPLILWCTHRALAGRSAYAIWAGVATGVMLLSTMFQYGFCVLVVSFGYGLSVAIWDLRSGISDLGGVRVRARIGRWARIQGTVLAVGLGVFAVQLLPLLEAKGLSARALMDVEAAMGPPGESLSAWDIVNMALPWAAEGKTGFASHAGLLVIGFAGLAFIRKPSRASWFFLGAGAFFLLLALGRHTPVYRIIHSIGIPGFALFKDPNRMSYPVYFCLAMLAGAGAASLEERLRRFGRFPGAAVSFVAAGSVALNLLWFLPVQRHLHGPEARFAMTSPDAAVRAILADGAQGRVYSTHPPLNLSRPSLFGLHGVDDWNTFTPLAYLQFTSGRAEVDPKAHTASQALLASRNRVHLAMLRYAYLAPAQAIALRLAEPFEILTTTVSGVLYRSRDSLPRTFVASNAVAIPHPEARLAYLDDPNFAPSREVVLETRTAPVPGGGTGTAQVIASSADRVEIAAETSGDSWLVLLDSYHPGWAATVDGAPAEVLVADHAFRAVELSAGRHRVVLTFRPAWFFAGAAISALTLAAVCGVFVFLRRNSRRPV